MLQPVALSSECILVGGAGCLSKHLLWNMEILPKGNEERTNVYIVV